MEKPVTEELGGAALKGEKEEQRQHYVVIRCAIGPLQATTPSSLCYAPPPPPPLVVVIRSSFRNPICANYC